MTQQDDSNRTFPTSPSILCFLFRHKFRQPSDMIINFYTLSLYQLSLPTSSERSSVVILPATLNSPLVSNAG